MLLPQALRWTADVCLDLGYSCCLGCYLSKENLSDKTDSGLHWCLFTQREYNSNPVGLLKIVMVEDGGFGILFCFSILKCSVVPPGWSCPPFTFPGQRQWPSRCGPSCHSQGGSHQAHQRQDHSQEAQLVLHWVQLTRSSRLLPFPSICNSRTQGFSECDSSSIALWGSHVQQFPQAQYFQSTYLCWTSYYW